MRPECEAAVVDALGRPVSAKEFKEMEDAVNLHMRLLAREDPEAWMKLSSSDRLQQGADAAVKAMTDAIQLKQARVKLQIAAHDRLENALNDSFENAKDKPGSLLHAVSQVLAFDPAGKGMRSVDTWRQSIEHEAMGQLLPLWNSVKGVAHLFENKEGIRALIKELFGEDSGNPAAKAAAQAWFKVTDGLRDRANASAMGIGKLDEGQYRFPQSNSQGRVAQAGLEKYTAATLPLLWRDKYLNEDGSRMSDEQMQDFLRHAYDSIITDGQNKVEPGKGNGYGSIADRQNAHRQLFFKDSDSYLTYQGLYGEKSLWPTLTGHIRAISRDIALSEVLGPNAQKTFQYFNDRTLLDELRQHPEADDKIRKAAKFNESLFDTVAGKGNLGDSRVAAAGQAFRNFEVATKLGQVIITALGDEAGMSATAFANHVPWSEVFAREFTYLNPANAEDRSTAAHAGLGINTMIAGLNRFGSEDMKMMGGQGVMAGIRNFTSKLANGVLHASGAEAMWDARRRALGSVLMSYLGKATREADFADINQADHGVLANKGVTETDWKVWQAAELEDWGMKHGVLTQKAIANIPDEKLAGLGNPDQLRRNAATLLGGHILEEVGMGVMDTGARERARMALGTQAGTMGGELVRSGMLFKGFSASMMMKHWARAASMPTGTDAAAYAARLVVMGTVMGAVANQLRTMVAGKDPPNIVEPRFWMEAALRGGGLGYYGDFLYSEMTQHDTSLIPALMGPLATEAETAWNLTGGAAFKKARGERTDEGGHLVRWARGNVPFLNMWYTRAAFDHLIWNDMQEAASPGYLDRMQSKAYSQRGTTYWWDPHEGAPSATPDFSKMFQPEKGREQLQAMEHAVPFIEAD